MAARCATMEFFRNRSLRTKLIGVFLAPTLLIVLLYGLLAYFAARQGLEDELGERLVSVGQAVSADLSGGFDARLIERLDGSKKRVRKRLRERLVETRDRTGVKRLFLFNRDLENLVDSEGPRPFGEDIYKLQVDRLEIDRTFEQAEATTSVLFEGNDGRLYKSAYIPITYEGRVVATLAVEASAEYFGLLRYFASVLTLLGAVGLALVVAAGTLFSRALTQPVNKLVEAARRLGHGELDEPVVELDDEDDDRPQRDEIAFLARSFEEMRRDVLDRDRQMKMMLSGIAHEVRNPLGGMELFCGLLQEDLEEAGDEEALEKLDRIEREVDYLDRVVDEFRNYAGETSLERERFAVDELLAELQGLTAGDIDEKGCELSLDVEQGLEATADREQIRRVVLNLIRNAYQACEGDDHIELEGHAPEPDMRTIVVRDDGPGMTDEQLEEMFTPFYTTKEKGSGLGLPLSKQIVEQHGGSLEVDTEPGEGTEVRIRLPFDDSIEASEPEVPEGWLG
jgi:signal transduction histidine kinase